MLVDELKSWTPAKQKEKKDGAVFLWADEGKEADRASSKIIDGMTKRQWKIVGILKRNPGISAADLAKKLDLPFSWIPPTMLHVIKKGMATREGANYYPTDRKYPIVTSMKGLLLEEAKKHGIFTADELEVQGLKSRTKSVYLSNFLSQGLLTKHSRLVWEYVGK